MILIWKIKMISTTQKNRVDNINLDIYLDH